MSDYNYAVFDMAKEEKPFHEFANHLHAGERAPDFPLEDHETGETINLSSLWNSGLAVIEFGSFT